LPLVDLARVLYQAVPQLLPAHEGDVARLFPLLASFATHVHPGVAAAAAGAVERMAVQCPKQRVALLAALANHALSQSDRTPRVQQQALTLYLHALQAAALPSSAPPQPQPTVVGAVTSALTPVTPTAPSPGGSGDVDPAVMDDAERVALLFCCSGTATVRTLALQILRLAASLGAAAGVRGARSCQYVGSWTRTLTASSHRHQRTWTATRTTWAVALWPNCLQARRRPPWRAGPRRRVSCPSLTAW
jgi:hypothetical protein